VIASGDGFSCAILSPGGQVECWGANDDRELGVLPTNNGWTPVRVGLPAPAVGVWADGSDGPCALLQDGRVWCWGLIGNYWNCPGDAPAVPAGSAPRAEPGFAAPVQALATGGNEDMSCALLATGAVQCWGQASTYLGDGLAAAQAQGLAQECDEYSARPVNVLPAGSGAIEVRTAPFDACALLAGGRVTCWGYNPDPTMLPGL
jgi:hypothetical protein